MIKQQTVEKAMIEGMRLAATLLPPDVEAALQKALAEEREPVAREHLEISLENARLASEGRGLVCGDTGFPLFFVKAGSDTCIEGGFSTLWKAAENATARCTEDAFLRPTMVDPLERRNPGDNIGPGMPKVELSFVENVEGLEIVCAPKGGGSEIFGTFYRMLFPSDGVCGVKKFVINCIKDSCYAGKICPPAIVGVGIGGTADLCMKLAKEAALLRPLGSRHKTKEVAKLEEDIQMASRKLGVGPMGSRGHCCVMGLHIETAMTHTAALPVAVNAQCLVGRRWTAFVEADNTIHFDGNLSFRSN